MALFVAEHVIRYLSIVFGTTALIAGLVAAHYWYKAARSRSTRAGELSRATLKHRKWVGWQRLCKLSKYRLTSIRSLHGGLR